MSAPNLVVVGDVILDRDVDGTVTRICPDAPAPVVDVGATIERPGGAGLAARLLHRQGAYVTLASSIGADSAGERIRGLLGEVRVVTLARPATNRTVTRIRSDGTTLVRLDTPAAPPTHPLDVAELARCLVDADAVLVSDYGRGVAADPAVRAVLTEAAATRPVVWDPHPLGPPPVPGTAVATPNRSEVEALTSAGTLAIRADDLRRTWNLPALVATDGGRGVVVVDGGRSVRLPVSRRIDGDTCGAGDRFAGTLARALAERLPVTEAAEAAIRDVAEWLDRGGVRAPVRGRLVATGGCFDVLHAGHVALLEAARRLGDQLVVLLNSDASVRRLKGPLRPVNGVADRRRVLESLSCVDEVIVFGEDDPRAALRRLRPDVWAKGGDYELAALPEAAVLPEWGGRVVLLPHLPHHSTTRILRRANGSGPLLDSQEASP